MGPCLLDEARLAAQAEYCRVHISKQDQILIKKIQPRKFFS
jgi:hypothetical protein